MSDPLSSTLKKSNCFSESNLKCKNRNLLHVPTMHNSRTHQRELCQQGTWTRSNFPWPHLFSHLLSANSKPCKLKPFFFVSIESSCWQGSPALPTAKTYFEICHSYGKKIMCDSKKQKKQKKQKTHQCDQCNLAEYGDKWKYNDNFPYSKYIG